MTIPINEVKSSFSYEINNTNNLDYLKTIENNFFNLIVTSPLYNIAIL